MAFGQSRHTIQTVAHELSSIERFFQNRGFQLVYGSYGRTGFAWQMGIGATCLAVGGGLLIAGLVSGVAGLLIGSMGPLIAGAINFPIGLYMRKRFQQAPNEPKMTQEARHFLIGLVRQTNHAWHQQGNAWAMRSNNHPSSANPLSSGETFFHQLGKQWGFIPKTPKDVLAKPLYELLETACFHYNRVQGMLEASRDAAAVGKVAQSVRSGADEAIFHVLHCAATMHKFPETIAASSRECESRIRALKDLADGLEKLQRQPHSFTDVPASTAMDSALEEVRLENLARVELGDDVTEHRLHEGR